MPKSEQAESFLKVPVIKDEVKLRCLSPGEKLIIPDLHSTVGDETLPLEGMKLNTPEMERKNMLEKLKDNAMKKGKDLVNRLTMAENTVGDKDAKQIVFTINEIEEERKVDLEDPIPVETAILSDFYGQAKYWFGKDYSNFIMKDWMNLDAPLVDMSDRTITPRMPWHDVGVCVVGASARDVARHFIQQY